MALVYVECGEGGVQATWHVSVLSWFGFICSAVVVDHSWVLTAAHCIDQHTHAVHLAWSGSVIHDLTLQIGGLGMSTDRLTVSYIAVHPNYNSTDRSYDLALLRLSSPLQFNHQLRPVCLPESSSQLFAGRSHCVVSGLAYSPLSGLSAGSSRLAEADAQLLTHDECVNATSTCGAFATLNNSSLICATLTQPRQRDICFGDSGSWLVCRDSDEDAWTVVGVSSWSLSSNCAVGIYARTTSASVLAWIRHTILADLH